MNRSAVHTAAFLAAAGGGLVAVRPEYLEDPGAFTLVWEAAAGSVVVLFVAARCGGGHADDLLALAAAGGGLALPEPALCGALGAAAASLCTDFWNVGAVQPSPRGVYRSVFTAAAVCLSQARWALYTDLYYTYHAHAPPGRAATAVALSGCAATLLLHLVLAFTAADALAGTAYYSAAGWALPRAALHSAKRLLGLQAAPTYVTPAVGAGAAACLYAWWQGFPPQRGYFDGWW